MPAQRIKQIEEEKGDPGGYADKDKEDKRRVQAKTDAGGGRTVFYHQRARDEREGSRDGLGKEECSRKGYEEDKSHASGYRAGELAKPGRKSDALHSSDSISLKRDKQVSSGWRMVLPCAIPVRSSFPVPERSGYLFVNCRPTPRYMKIVATLTDPVQASIAQEQGAGMIECRLDLMEGVPVELVRQCRKACSLPVIVTLRSGQEGGQFFGDADEWIDRIRPVIPFAEYIDIEQRFALHAAEIKARGKQIIASHHYGLMMPLCDLFVLERELRAYGDIPKIIVTPQNDEDLLELLVFTQAAKKPVCTGVMGAQFRYGRAILPLFGSEFVYCHTGTPAAEGQYSVEVFARLMQLMK